MGYAHFIKELGRGADGARDLSADEAHQLYAAMLDGGVPDLELGAMIIALRVKGESVDEMLGFLAAVNGRTNHLELPHGRVRPVVLPTYNGARKEANLTPLLALLLQRFGVPVLVHGLIEGFGRVTTAQVLRELGIMPVTSVLQAQNSLAEKGLAFAPLSLLCPGLHNLLSLRSRMGVRSSAHSLVKMLSPFHQEAVLVAAATHPDFIELMRNMLVARGERGILLRGTEGEPFANPKRRPALSTCTMARSTCFLKPNTKACAVCPVCLSQPMRQRRQNGSSAYWIDKFRCPNRLPISSPAASMLPVMPRISIRPRRSLPSNRMGSLLQGKQRSALRAGRAQPCLQSIASLDVFEQPEQ